MYRSGFVKQGKAETQEAETQSTDLFVEDKIGSQNDNLFTIDIQGQEAESDDDDVSESEEEADVSENNKAFGNSEESDDENIGEDDEEEKDIDDTDDENYIPSGILQNLN